MHCPLRAASRCSSPTGSGTWANSTARPCSWRKAAPRPAVWTACWSRPGTSNGRRSLAARAFGADHVFFVTNGTSTSNKMVVQALLAPGDIAIIDRNCHKSHHYGMVLSGGQPLYVEAFPMTEYSMYGAVPLRTIKQALLAARAEGRLDRVKLLDLTNCTFDGHIYNTRRVMEECLAIKPDLIFPVGRGVVRLCALVAVSAATYRHGRCCGHRGLAARSGQRDGLRTKACRTGGQSIGRCAARSTPGSRSTQGPPARLPDQLHPQVDVGAAPGIDGPGQGRRLSHGGGTVPRGGVHPRLDQPEPATDREPGCRATPDGAGGLRSGDPTRSRSHWSFAGK